MTTQLASICAVIPVYKQRVCSETWNYQRSLLQQEGCYVELGNVEHP